jgi:hypothetical protein
MVSSKHSPLFVAKELFETRFSGADVAFMAGSVVRGEASTYSDLDLVVIYPKVEYASRESFTHRDWPVEVFVHDPETLKYFHNKVDALDGRASLYEMIYEGLEVPGPSPISDNLKELAARSLSEGPRPLTPTEIEDRRYMITFLLDDIREPKSRDEVFATSATLFNEVADFYLRSRGLWSASGKSLIRRLKKADAGFARRFVESFDQLQTQNQPQRLIDLVSEVLAEHGGFLFEGYSRKADPRWRG